MSSIDNECGRNMIKSSKSVVSERPKKQYNSIDLCKFIMAFAVVALHTCPFETCTNKIFLNIYDLFVCMAVPFFFLASGYLLAAKMQWPYNTENDLLRILLHLKKIIRMYIIWTIVYLPLAIYGYVEESTSPVKAILLYIRRLMFVGEQYNSWHLWYLLSTVYALLVVYLVLKKWKNPKLLFMISVIGSVISIGITIIVNCDGNINTFLVIFKKMISYSIGTGRIFSGLIYIPVGIILFQKRIPLYINYIFLFGGYIANYFVQNSIISSYLLIITSVGLFGVVKSINLKNNPIYTKLRHMSTIIYLLHMYIWSIYYKITYGEKTFGMDSFLVTSIVAVVVSLIYIEIISKCRQKHNLSSRK